MFQTDDVWQDTEKEEFLTEALFGTVRGKKYFSKSVSIQNGTKEPVAISKDDIEISKKKKRRKKRNVKAPEQKNCNDTLKSSQSFVENSMPISEKVQKRSLDEKKLESDFYKIPRIEIPQNDDLEKRLKNAPKYGQLLSARFRYINEQVIVLSRKL